MKCENAYEGDVGKMSEDDERADEIDYLMTHHGLTLEQAAKKIGISAERARRVLTKYKHDGEKHRRR